MYRDIAQRLQALNDTLLSHSAAYAAQRYDDTAQRKDVDYQTETLGTIQTQLDALKATFELESQNIAGAWSKGLDDLNASLSSTSMPAIFTKLS